MEWGHELERCDLHLHTTYSDGNLSVNELIELLRYYEIKAISITDHDSVKGQREAELLCGELGIEYISGVEISTILNNKEIHILGYGFDTDNVEINELFDRIQKGRIKRTVSILEKLENYGIFIDIKEFGSNYMDKNIGRPHIAQKMYEKGWIKSYDEAFQKYLYNNGPCYVPKIDVHPKEAIRLVHNAGGVSVLAHPGLMLNENDIENVIESGIDGIEIYYPKHTETQKHRFIEMARSNGLLETGGSDFHGKEKDYQTLKSHSVPYEIFSKLRRRCDQRRFNEKAQHKK